MGCLPSRLALRDIYGRSVTGHSLTRFSHFTRLHLHSVSSETVVSTDFLLRCRRGEVDGRDIVQGSYVYDIVVVV